MSFEEIYRQNAGNLEDFWGRRDNAPSFQKQVTLFGHQLTVVSNHQTALTAVDCSLPLFSDAPSHPHRPFHIQIVVRAGVTNPGMPPPDLFPIIQYTGDQQWLMLHVGAWGQAFVDTEQSKAVIAITPELAAQPQTLSQGLLNTVILNLVIGSGHGMLHASGLMRGDRLLLLVAPHNTGKSTTAFRLALAGYQFVSDSHLYISPYHDTLHLCGFPVGRVKLRGDMVPAFPQFQQYLTSEKVQVRDETKYVVNLREVAPEMMVSAAITPQTLDLCLLSRGNGEKESRIMPASFSELRDALMQNSLFYDTKQAWQANWQQIERVIDHATPNHLVIGTDADHIVQTVNELLS
jgi:hypothetical protein